MKEEKKDIWNKIERNAHDFKSEAELIGTLKEVVPSIFQGNDFIINDEEGKEIYVYGKTALQTKMTGINAGTKVKIVFLGEKTSEKGRLYEDFDVYTKWVTK